MAGETDLHKTLKKEGARWLFRMGYRCIAAEVRLAPLGIIDVVGAGVFGPYRNYLHCGRDVQQTVFIECKASRGDFLADHSRNGQLLMFLKQQQKTLRPRRRKTVALGKFQSCLARPMANLHYVLSPAGLIKKADLPPRWGLLTLGEAGVGVTVKADWVECNRSDYVEGAIARTLTGDIFRADDRALASINREMFQQQIELAERIRKLKPVLLERPTQAMPMV